MLVALSIPLSLLITLLSFRLIGISLNIISLSGLILGVGMIVDNSIIVIDNILQKESQPKVWRMPWQKEPGTFYPYVEFGVDYL